MRGENNSKVIHPKYYKNLAYDLAHEMGFNVQYNDKSILFTLQFFLMKIILNSESKSQKTEGP